MRGWGARGRWREVAEVTSPCSCSFPFHSTPLLTPLLALTPTPPHITHLCPVPSPPPFLAPLPAPPSPATPAPSAKLLCTKPRECWVCCSASTMRSGDVISTTSGTPVDSICVGRGGERGERAGDVMSTTSGSPLVASAWESIFGGGARGGNVCHFGQPAE